MSKCIISILMFDLSEEQIESFRKVFAMFDKDRNGAINRSEMVEAFDQLNIKLSEEQIDNIFKKFDENGNYSIEFDEFVSILTRHTEKDDCEAWLFETFQILDQDCDGRLSKSELLKVIKLYQLDIPQKEVNQILESFQDGLGEGISYEEFASLLNF